MWKWLRNWGTRRVYNIMSEISFYIIYIITHPIQEPSPFSVYRSHRRGFRGCFEMPQVVEKEYNHYSAKSKTLNAYVDTPRMIINCMQSNCSCRDFGMLPKTENKWTFFWGEARPCWAPSKWMSSFSAAVGHFVDYTYFILICDEVYKHLLLLMK